MTRYRVPFGAVYAPDDAPETFTPGVVLAKAAAELGPESGSREEGTVERTFDTAWGSLQVERRGRGELLTETPAHGIPGPPVMLQAACRRLGVEPVLVEKAGGGIQVVDVGRPVLVVPMPDPDEVRKAPAEGDVGAVPGADAEGGVVYAQTQRTPYVKLLARVWGEAEPLTALAAAACHRTGSGAFRPTYPRTRFVAQLVNQGEEQCEITVEAEKVGGEPKVTKLLVGGKVDPLE